ncbi:metallophosphoesterase family protein [Metabacillus schmidteae]|uniref:hypothetical protein n=1 Tax=Metabacillus schmidteae TaxID=2730405 RepID=UPI00158B5506|nr:hypothetical protein [Metabacillus schmidteae]
MELPMILSGPILRRVDCTQVTIWLATSEKVSITAKVLTIQQSEYSLVYEELPVHTQTKTITLGKKLFVHLIKVNPTHKNFPVEQLLGYNLYLQKGTQTYDLDSFQLLTESHPDSLIYEGLDYPTFYINTKKESPVLYGSCRKAHGKGQDALPNADRVISQHRFDLNLRPSSLFMLGDQIYADDIADPLVPYIQAIVHYLIGKREDLTFVEPKLHQHLHHLYNIQGRQHIIETLCKFTSSNAHNHLISFGEYAAMYLLSWSPVLWNLFTNEQNKSFKTLEGNEEQVKELHNFRSGTSKVRRVLANIPTYMIFDDHDITDDWNISAEWIRKVYRAPLGKHTICNGLTAFWVFQGWGNQPENFDDAFIQTIQQYVKTYPIGSKYYQDWQDTLLSFDSWHFIAPTAPRTLCLDTRTLRDYDSSPTKMKLLQLINETPKTPILIGKKGWELLDQLLKSNEWKNGDSLRIASPTPLYGVDVIEKFLKNQVYPFRSLGMPVQYQLDFEAWKYNLTGFYSFLHFLSKHKPSECIILSGDVHYASAIRAHVNLNGAQLSIYQLTSSPMKNISFDMLTGSMMKLIVWLITLGRNEPIRKSYGKKDGAWIELKSDTPDTIVPIWEEQIFYQALERGTIIETQNNLGLLLNKSSSIQNTLLINSDNDNQFEPFKN